MKKKQSVFFGFAVLIIVAMFSLAGCESAVGCDCINNGSGGNGNGTGSGSKPATLSSGASWQDAMNKLDEIIAYCDNNPGNSQWKSMAQAYKGSISASSIKDNWTYTKTSVISYINDTIIANLTGGSGSGSGNGTGTGTGSKPATLSSSASWQDAMDKLDEIINYCDNTGGNVSAKSMAQAYKGSISASSIKDNWTYTKTTVISYINDTVIPLIQ